MKVVNSFTFITAGSRNSPELPKEGFAGSVAAQSCPIYFLSRLQAVSAPLMSRALCPSSTYVIFAFLIDDERCAIGEAACFHQHAIVFRSLPMEKITQHRKLRAGLFGKDALARCVVGTDAEHLRIQAFNRSVRARQPFSRTTACSCAHAAGHNRWWML